jgi:hypothetical protein
MTYKKTPSIKHLKNKEFKKREKESLKNRSQFIFGNMTKEQHEIWEKTLKESINTKTK